MGWGVTKNIRITKKSIGRHLVPQRVVCLKIPMKPKLHLGAASLNNCKALLVPISSKLVPEMFLGLVDSGFSDSFIDLVFVINNKLAYQDIEPCPLSLIDGIVNNCINWTVTLSMKFPCSTLMGIKRFDHEIKVKARSERRCLRTASQLCTKQVGTGKINQIIESLLKVNVQRITKTY